MAASNDACPATIFVLLGTQHDGYCVPLLDATGELAMFCCVRDAYKGAGDSFLGRRFGYKVFDSEGEGL
jgi:hypothetical protein